MEYKKVIGLLDNTPNQTSKFMTKNVVEIMMAHLERTTPAVKFNLKLHC